MGSGNNHVLFVVQVQGRKTAALVGEAGWELVGGWWKLPQRFSATRPSVVREATQSVVQRAVQQWSVEKLSLRRQMDPQQLVSMRSSSPSGCEYVSRSTERSLVVLEEDVAFLPSATKGRSSRSQWRRVSSLVMTKERHS